MDKLIFTLACVLTTVLLSVVLAQVLCRNLFNFSFIQVEGCCVLIMAWFIFLVVVYAVRHCGHVVVDSFFQKIARPAEYVLNPVTTMGPLFPTLYMTCYDYGLSTCQMKTPLLIIHIPRGCMYLVVPVCSAIMVLFLPDALINCIRKKSIEGVVVDTDKQIDQELESGKKLMEEVPGDDGKGGRQ